MIPDLSLKRPIFLDTCRAIRYTKREASIFADEAGIISNYSPFMILNLDEKWANIHYKKIPKVVVTKAKINYPTNSFTDNDCKCYFLFLKKQ